MTQGRGTETELDDGNLSRRLPAYLAASLLTALIIQATLFAALKGPSFDEVIDIAAGYAYLRTGTYRLCPEHPALATALSSAPLLLLDLRDPAEDPEFSAQRRWQFALGTLHQNRTPAARILFLARLPSILLLGLLGWLLYRFGAAEFGPWGGVGALFLLATSPTFIAHSALATGDSIVAVFSFAAFVSIRRCLDRITWPRILLAGAALGAALASKMTAFILLPVAVMLVFTDRPMEVTHPFGKAAPSWGGRRGPAMIALLLVLLISVLTLHGIYLGRIFADHGAPPSYLNDPATLDPGGRLARAALAATEWFVPEEYAYGLRELVHSASRGWPYFLLGQTGSRSPIWAYPYAAAVKSREAVLLGLPIALFIGWRTGRRRMRLVQMLLVPCLLLLGLAVGGGYHGARNLLPACPFLFLIVGGVAGGLARRGRRARWGLLVGTAVAMAPCLISFPDYLAYQNFLAGGRGGDYERLVDSDLDWGQDLPALSRRLRDLGHPPVRLVYFGRDDPRAYDFPFQPLTDCKPVKGYVAISATHLQGVYLPDPNCFAWLRRQEPVARAGRSILIYHVR